MEKWKDILLILLIVAVLVILMRMSKVMQLQSETLLGVASKLGVVVQKPIEVEEEEIEEDVEEEETEVEEEESEGEAKEETESEDEEEETNTESEPEVVEAEVINEKGEIISIPTAKIIPIRQPAQTASKPVQAESPQQSSPVVAELKKSRKEIYDMILRLFKDGIPRKRKAIEDALNIPNVRTGYMADVISTMKEKGMLGGEYIDLKDKWKSYYIFGLPAWFKKDKLTPEYSKKFKS